VLLPLADRLLDRCVDDRKPELAARGCHHLGCAAHAEQLFYQLTDLRKRVTVPVEEASVTPLIATRRRGRRNDADHVASKPLIAALSPR